MGFLSKIEGDFGNFYVDFFCKIEREFNFWWKWRKVKLKGISFKMAFYPRASLARAVFSFKTFFDPRYRPPTPIFMDESESEVKVKWSESEVKSESIFGPSNLMKLIYVVVQVYT